MLGCKLLIREIEENLGAKVIDIPAVKKGSNNYVFHIKLSNGSDIVARLSRGNVNMPNFDGFPICSQVSEVKFEVAVYKLLRSEPNILVSRLLYNRIPVDHVGHRLDPPQDIAGRRLFVFEKAEGEKDIWWELKVDEQVRAYFIHVTRSFQLLALIFSLGLPLAQAARIRASLFKFDLPDRFAEFWLRERLFQRSSEQKPKSFPIPVAPTREFCIAMFESEIRAIIRNQGDKIECEDDNYSVGPAAAAAKRSLLHVLPHILPADSKQPSLYRLVLEHGDFGIHNMSITLDANGQPLVTSLFDWAAGCILPTILSDPLMRLSFDLVGDNNGAPSVTREVEDATPEDCAEHMRCARVYFKALYEQVPNYKRAIQAGKTHATFGLPCKTGEMSIRMNISVIWELGLRERWRAVAKVIRVTDHGHCPMCGV